MTSSHPSDAEREAVLALLKRHGTHATSFQILESGIEYWWPTAFEEADAVIAFCRVRGYRLVVGAPIAAEDQMSRVSRQFIAESQADGGRVIFFCVEQDLVDALAGESCDVVPIGVQGEIAPATYDLNVRSRRSLRSQVRRAVNKSVEVRCISPAELAEQSTVLRDQIDSILQRWLSSRRMAIMRFMVDLQPFTFPTERRYFIAEQHGRPVGFLAAVPVYRRAGWFFEDVIRVPDAPNGTVELLIHTALSHAVEQGDQYVTMGLSPLAMLDQFHGSSPFYERLFRFAYDHSRTFYQFSGVHRFKSRFRPNHWEPQYLIVAPGKLNVSALVGIASAFTGGHFGRFAMNSINRVIGRLPRQWLSNVVGGLGVFLIPWTILLSLADGIKWFGSSNAHTAWVVFDTLMTFALLVTAWMLRHDRPYTRLILKGLSLAFLADFALTTGQVVQLHLGTRGWDWFWISAGIIGPLLVAVLLGVLGYADRSENA